jgi:heat-inducible transcriptional repressor
MIEEGKLRGRKREILAAIVRQYISNGVPVGSKALAGRLDEAVSPATIRHVMAELEDSGYLSQPHVSAGRVPTDMAYRLYVDWIAGTTQLGKETERFIRETLTAERATPEQLMALTSHVLAEVSRQVGIVLGPKLEEKLLEHIKFVKLPERRVLAVIVSKPDLVENKVIRLEEDFSQQELDGAAEFLNAEFRGWSLRTVRLEIFGRLAEMKSLCDRLLSSIGTLFVSGALGDEEPGTLFVEGTRNFLEQAGVENFRVVRDLLATFEEKVKLIKILSACLESSQPGVRTVIGRENPNLEMQDCAIVVAPYHYRARAVGVLGVVGPTRMEYDRTITAVDYVARLCSRLLSAN